MSVVAGGAGPLRERGPALPYVPGDEGADHLGAVPLAGEASELFPQVIFDPDGPVRRVGFLHGVIVTAGYAAGLPRGLPCISTVGMVAKVSVYIHGNHDSAAQLGIVGGRCMTGARTLPDHEKCATHKNYSLSCDQYEGLLKASGGRCQVCGFPAAQMPQQKLYIDHDNRRGHWAVRGLLCHRCNTVLGIDRDIARSPELAAYLTDAWYIRMLVGLGLTPDVPPEPPVGALVKFGHHTSPPRRRTAKGWVVESKWHLGTRTWRDLYHSWGPHRLHVVELPHPRRRARQ